MYDVITVGSATVDAFINTGSRLFQKTYKKYVKVPFGSKILISDLKFDIGGGGTNTAVAFSRMGLKTAWIGSIGLGTNSKRVLNLLKKEKVDISFAQQGNGRTGFSVILDAIGHDRTILTFKGNNDNLEFKKIPLKEIKTKWFYFSAMLNQSLETQKKLASFAKKNNISIAYNPSSYLVKKGVKYIKDILDNTDLLILNKEEAGYLVGKKPVDIMLKRLFELGINLVVITDGKNKVYAYEGSHIHAIKPHKVKILETTGAGDAFASGFLAGIIKKGDIEFALKVGLANSESVITHYGAKNKLLRWSGL
ncbi:MAG: carbohydrate kinase family protein [Nanoarchaeota archaeon]|nr:carbohydrate kinase family protein [Nanoarchaeota archaeon]